MENKLLQVNRRNFLRGLGVCLAVPAFESVVPLRALGAALPQAATTASGAPLRMAFLYVPNGVNKKMWKPTGAGSEYELGPSLQSLAPYRNDFQIISKLEQKNGWAGADGAGDHARANASILTGARPKKTAGADIRVGVSVDQLAAKHLADTTRFPSLELSCDGVRKSGSCDSGYSCAYQFNLSWRSETTPVAPESHPRLVFERLFGSGKPGERQRNFDQRIAQQRSILDFVMDDAKSMQRQLGRNDQQKLDEYLTGVREIENRIQKAERFRNLPDPQTDTPSGIPTDYREHIRLMGDMLVLAFQTDSTRVGTFLLAHDGSNRSFKDIGVSDGHHNLSHHQNKADILEKIAKIDTFYAEQFAYFLKRMRETKDRDGKSLLDNSMVVYCSGLGDGNAHSHNDLPVILAGRGGGAFNPGRHFDPETTTPMNNLYVTMLNRMGVKVDSFGDSTGALQGV
ncbi:MAG TPA: DUF1552 domain-containing protein [Candidatus Limnocylindria bacterium]|nr:DUF1552 domain-containing protein [Candidatus Limnocylindria bacterium]